MKIPFISSKSPHIDEGFLRTAFSKSTKMYNDIVNSAKSKTLEELYTDEFRPQKTKSFTTTVKSLRTGKPVNVELNSEMLTGFSLNKSHRLNLSLIINKIIKLGYKSFGINLYKNGVNEFETGRILSYKNQNYAGIQIRLLQAAIEHAKRYGIKLMPLKSLLQPIKFHTMMGFRPIRTFDYRINNYNDFQKAIKKCYQEMVMTGLKFREVIPIISKTKGRYYLDVNRTIYCSMMKHNDKIAQKEGLDTLKFYDSNPAALVYMEMKGREFNKWLERIKGFEILPDIGFPEPHFGFFKKMMRKWFQIIYE